MLKQENSERKKGSSLLKDEKQLPVYYKSYVFQSWALKIINFRRIVVGGFDKSSSPDNLASIAGLKLILKWRFTIFVLKNEPLY